MGEHDWLRTRNLYDPGSPKAFKLSRSKIEDFIRCPRCFYLDRRLGLGRPETPPFNLNKAVDELLKKEFDQYRERGERHPLMAQHGIDAKPHKFAQLDDWRENFKGVQHHHKGTNLLITGAIDDLWINPKGEFVIVDYKATSKKERIDRLNDGWHISYKRQMEIYQWLVAQNGHPVSRTGYFVYCNAMTDRESFSARLDFDINIIPYTGDPSWVEGALVELHKCLGLDTPPPASSECDYCAYLGAAQSVAKLQAERSPSRARTKK